MEPLLNEGDMRKAALFSYGFIPPLLFHPGGTAQRASVLRWHTTTSRDSPEPCKLRRIVLAGGQEVLPPPKGVGMC